MRKHNMAALAFGVVAVVASLMFASTADALPEGWTFHCDGTTGVYLGPEVSFMTVENHHACS